LWAIATGRKWIDDGKPVIETAHIKDPLPSR
jgi:hypothetical protein